MIGYKKVKNMKREIKFRAWVDNGAVKEMHYPNEIQINSADAMALQLKVGFKNAYPEKNRICDWQKNIVFQQFTGLQDSKGVDIYEGDILQDNLTIAKMVVVFGHNKNNAYNGWFCKYIGIDIRDISINGDYDTNQNSRITVIGNIYQNPELLKP